MKPTTVDVNTTVKVNGATVASGTTSSDIPLAVGNNTITTVATAQDGSSTATYTIIVTRAGGALNSIYQLATFAGTTGLQRAADGILIHNGLSPNGDGINDFLLIEGITAYPDNKLQIINRTGQLVFEAKNYDNSTKVFDGHSNKTGAMQLPGTYFYALDYMTNGVKKHKTGFIVLKY